MEERQYGTSYGGEDIPPCELEEPGTAGSYPLGLIGALLGAVVGAVPWFLASTFTNFFIGWLGFLVGWCACWGYQKCRGARRTGYAMTVVILCSIFAIVLSDFASNMYLLCTDFEWQRAARYEHISVYQLAAGALLMPENLQYILPNLGIGLLIGGLGIFSARRQVLEYTDPKRAAELAARAAPAFQPAALGTTGMSLPYSFTVRMNKSTRNAGKILMGVAGALVALLVVIGAVTDSLGEVLPVTAILGLILVLEAVFLLRMGQNFRLEVEGERLRFVTRGGKVREFAAGDIGSVSASSNLQRVLYDREGKVLAKLNNNMENLLLLSQYLTEHNVPLRG